MKEKERLSLAKELVDVVPNSRLVSDRYISTSFYRINLDELKWGGWLSLSVGGVVLEYRFKNFVFMNWLGKRKVNEIMLHNIDDDLLALKDRYLGTGNEES